MIFFFFVCVFCQPRVRRARPPRRSGCVSASPLKNLSEGLSRRTAGVAIAAKPNSSLYSRSWAHAAVVSVWYYKLHCPVAPSSHSARLFPDAFWYESSFINMPKLAPLLAPPPSPVLSCCEFMNVIQNPSTYVANIIRLYR